MLYTILRSSLSGQTELAVPILCSLQSEQIELAVPILYIAPFHMKEQNSLQPYHWCNGTTATLGHKLNYNALLSHAPLRATSLRWGYKQCSQP